MSLPDQIMMDSPAQTPEAKNQSQQQSAPRAGSSSGNTAGEMAMMAEDESTGAHNAEFLGGAIGSWDTKQWRDEVATVTSKLQHPKWNPCEDAPPPPSGPLDASLWWVVGESLRLF